MSDAPISLDDNAVKRVTLVDKKTMNEIFLGDNLRKWVGCRRCKGSRGRWRYSTGGSLKYVLCLSCMGTGKLILLEAETADVKSHPVIASRITTHYTNPSQDPYFGDKTKEARDE